MFLEKISFEDAFKISPWPSRLLGFDSWEKPLRDTSLILKEYNEGWYGKILDLWRASHKGKSGTPLPFYEDVQNIILTSMFDHPEVYGLHEDKHLISVHKNLYRANWSSVNALYDQLLQDTLSSYIQQFDIQTAVELGCGAGGNLFKLSYKNNLRKIIGGDICPNAVTLGEEILDAFPIQGHFREFDYYKPSCLTDLMGDISENYMIFTSHSIEQIQVGKTTLFDQIKNLSHKPKVVVHLEPMAVESESFFGKLCKKYAAINRYNLDLLAALHEKERAKEIEILSHVEAVYGISAFNPTSVIAWRIRD